MTKYHDSLAGISSKRGSAFEEFVEKVMGRYEKTAPAVVAYIDDLYQRVSECPADVTLWELRQVSFLLDEHDTWEHPNFAQNRIYKLAVATGREHEIMDGGMMIDH